MNRTAVLQTFRTYTDAYDSSDPKIALKIEHTYHVAENAERIAGSLSLSDEDTDLCWLLGMLHDIGRFEQVRRYGTFNDSLSIPHARMSCEVLFPERYKADSHFSEEMPNGRFGRIEDYLPGQDIPEETLDLINTAVFLHSAWRLPEDLTPRDRMFCCILRDADKVDILRVNAQTPLTDINSCTEEEIRVSSISERVMTAVSEHHAVKRIPGVSMTPADHIAAHCCLVFELVYPESRKIVLEQGYLGQLLAFRNDNEETGRRMKVLQRELEMFLREASA